ncbi:threonine/serine dehydratase [Chloroflexota bacterium]
MNEITSTPTFQDVLLARRLISKYLPRTPLHHYPSLSKLLGGEVYVKHENHHSIGSFKVRGALNVIAHFTEEERRQGVIIASTGNYSQAVAIACRLFNIRALVVMPEGANPEKVEATQNLGAEVIFHGHDFEDAREHTEALALERGYRYIHSINEPLLVAGAATQTLEILEDLPQVEIIIAPIGGGSTAAGACIVAKTINPQIQVIAVQAEKAPAAYLSWKERRLVEAPVETFAEGLATRTGYELTQEVLRQWLDDFVLVSEEELRQAIVLFIEKTHNLVEAAGAASLAAAMKIKERLQGHKVALIQSGGNITLPSLRQILNVR